LPSFEAGIPEVEEPSPEKPTLKLEIQRADLRAVCTDPQLQLDFAALSQQMGENGFLQFLDYTVPQFGRDNFTRAFHQPEVPAYGDVVFLAGEGRPQVNAELVTPFDNGDTLTTTNLPLRSWPVPKPSEHLIQVESGADVRKLLDIHRKRIIILSDSEARPLPCRPEDYLAQVSRHYEESLSYATKGRTARQFGEGPGCALAFAMMAGLGIVAALLLRR
jgi:hypothetical protein